MPDDFQTFFKQLSRKDTTRAHALLDAHPDWATDPQALLEACHQGKAPMVRRLLEAGADPDMRSSGTPGAWRTPLMRAAALPDAEIVGILLDAGADPNGRAGHGMFRPVGHAADAGNAAAVAMLLARGSERDLEVACSVGDADAVRAALAADPAAATATRTSGRGHFTAYTAPLDRVAASRLGIADPAVRAAHLDIVGQLLAAGAERLDKAAGEAAFAGNAAVFEAVIDAGAAPAAVLSLALQGGHPDVLAVLSKHPLALDVFEDPDVHGWLLTQQARFGRAANVLWMLEQGADADVVDGFGNSVLHYAARRGFKPDWFEAVVAAGADLSRVDAEGHTVLDIARAKKKKRLVAWLESR